MQYRKIGESNLQLSVITFGAWAVGGWLWGGADRKEAVEAIKTAYDLGVTSIDTAPVYGQGVSEEIVGEAIRGISRDKVQILTKYGMRWDLAKGTLAMKSRDNNGKDIDIYKYSGKESIIKECEDSLRRLGTDHIDLYQIHWHDVTTPIGETMEAVSRLIQQGKVLHAGVCNYGVAEMEEAAKHINLVSDQIPYSMMRRDIEKDVLPYCIEHKKSILAYSPLQRGLLTGKIKPGYHFNEGDSRETLQHYKSENIERTNTFLQKIKPIANEKNATLAQLVISWTLQQPGITIALVGARNAAQAIQNAGAINVQLSAEEIKLITTELDQLVLVK
ncbi:aldo/keto reductase [Ferruginibacter albus]|uniref:aldo/keto reductase n=1 Tax=Ferruginibacter albus TaxID=2875540 RepID=UPI001CC60714|nr:aldo/keto reductase [Ferruginibacter albus]UAY53159.1 aldo/keto reductase [Ferruginibacter albus]